MISHALKIGFAVVAFVAMASATPFPKCEGSAYYYVKFTNMLTPAYFGDSIPETGLVYSPLAAVSHSGRVSFFTIRGFASTQVDAIAERGDNTPFLNQAERMYNRSHGVKSYAGAEGPTLPGEATELRIEVDCNHSFVTAISMIAPSPDWIVQINNLNLYDTESDKFVDSIDGDLIAYDAGTDDGDEFTAPDDLSLDKPTKPQMNIAPLSEDMTDAFDGQVVGRYVVYKVEM